MANSMRAGHSPGMLSTLPARKEPTIPSPTYHTIMATVMTHPVTEIPHLLKEI